MGIRIHKYLGYGLVDVKVDNYSIVDDRFDPLGYAMSEWQDQEETWTMDGFETYYKNHCKMFPWMFRNKEKELDIYDCISNDTEYGMENVFLLTPPSCVKQWKRYDDIIDYTEESLKKEEDYGNFYKIIPAGIWPWQSSYDDKRTGEWLSSYAHEFKFHERNFQPNSASEVQATLIFLNHCAKELEFKNYDEARDNIVPRIPEEIVLLCRYLCLFNDDSTIWELKPMLYVYWG